MQNGRIVPDGYTEQPRGDGAGSKAAWRLKARRAYRVPLVGVLAALSLVVVLGSVGASAQAPTLQGNGKIAFVSARSGDPEIYTMNPDGTQVAQLTDNRGPQPGFFLLDFWPNWSPDGAKIVYTSFRFASPGAPPTGDIFVMNADGTGKTRVTNDPTADLNDPAFFPDGRRVVFVREVPGPFPGAPAADQDIWTMNIDGTDARNLTPGPQLETEPAVSPDGTRIAFERGVAGAEAHDLGNHEIFTMKADGSDVQRLTDSPGRREQHPSYSPDGTRIVFDDNFHAAPEAPGFIYSMKVDGSDVTQLTSRGDRHGLPSYSPDGTKITFTAGDDIWTMDPDGSNQARLTDHPQFDIQSNWQPIPPAAPQPVAPTPTPAPAPVLDTCPVEGSAGYLWPAKLRVRRVEVDRRGRVLDVFAPITSRARGDVDVIFQAAGRTDRFAASVTEGSGVFDRIRFEKRITRAQAALGTGIVTLRYKGDANTRPEEVRLRAADRSPRLDVERLSLIDGRLSARGSVSERARGIVRLRFSYIDANGNPQVYPARARIQGDGEWRLSDDVVPPQVARCGGYLSILFTGFFPERIRGEQLAYQLNPGQVRQPTTGVVR